jgi:hypothetical protein
MVWNLGPPMTDFLQLAYLRTISVTPSVDSYVVEVVVIPSSPRCHHCNSMRL